MSRQNDNDVVIMAVVVGGGLLITFSWMINNILRAGRIQEWYQLHMPLLPDSSNLRLDAALRDAEEGFNVCTVCKFENLKRNIFCTMCGDPIEMPEDGEALKDKSWRQKRKEKKERALLHTENPELFASNDERKQRVLRRREWTRKVDVEGNAFWYRDGAVVADPPFPGVVVRFRGDVMDQQHEYAKPIPDSIRPPSSHRDSGAGMGNDDHIHQNRTTTPAAEAISSSLESTTASVEGRTSLGRGETVEIDMTDARSPSASEQDHDQPELNEEEQRRAKAELLGLSTLGETSRRLGDERGAHSMEIENASTADPYRFAIVVVSDSIPKDDIKQLSERATLDFPTKIAEFVTRTATILVPRLQSVLKLKIQRNEVLQDSIETLAAMPQKFSRCTFRMEFVGEQGIDAGGVYREWLVLIYEQIVTPAAGIFKCVNQTEQTLYLNPHSRHDIGEFHLSHFFAVGRLLGRGLLEGNVTGFHLSLPLLKIILGMPVSLSDLEYYDPQVFRSLLWMVEHDGVDALGLDFSVCEQVGSETVVVDLVPNGRHIPVTDVNKLEFVDCKFKYLLFDSVADQLYAFLRGLYEVIPPEILMLFDAEELDYVVSGSNEIDVNDWERNSKYTEDLIDHPVREWFWELAREMPDEYRRRLLQFATGSSRVPLAGFMAMTSYDGHLCPFTLKGVDVKEEGYIRSHACFNRLDLPRYHTKARLKNALYAVLDTELYGFTTA